MTNRVPMTQTTRVWFMVIDDSECRGCAQCAFYKARHLTRTSLPPTPSLQRCHTLLIPHTLHIGSQLVRNIAFIVHARNEIDTPTRYEIDVGVCREVKRVRSGTGCVARGARTSRPA